MPFMTFLKKILTLSCFTAILASCAVNGVMRNEEASVVDYPSKSELHQRFYILGGAANGDSEKILSEVKNSIKLDSAIPTSILYIGDNVNEKSEKGIKKDLDRQIAVEKETGANAYFVPGNYDWAYDANDGLEVMEDYLESKLNREEVLTPNNGCPIESVDISEDVQLIVVDSQWYINDWDRLHEMNDKCEIKTREKLLNELGGEFKKSANKTIILAMHHPIFTNGSHGGRFSFRDHIFPLQGNIPLPLIGTLVTQIRAQGAISVQDRYNKRYKELSDHILNVLESNSDKRIILVSGHERNLQYIEKGSVKQIISGSAGDTRPVSISDNGLFSYGGQGFVVLDVHKDTSVWSAYYGLDSNGASKLLFRNQVLEKAPMPVLDTLPTTFPTTVQASVYDLEKVQKSDFFKSFWGDHYREVYGKKVTAKVALLDTLYGGLEVVRPGGGHQTRSLRLVTKDGKEYNMRALKKSAVQFLETTGFKGIDAEKYFRNTVPEDLIMDFYTAAHPYGAFAIPTLAKAAGVYYTTPELFFVPQQHALGKYNKEYGNQLYMIVERPAEEYEDRKSFGYPDDIESTDDLLQKLREDEAYVLDEAAYIRARIFDMLIGDWDRHSDQWRWAEFEKDGGKVFVPIPRDRDQVFANFDGTFLNLLRSIMGSANQFGIYGPDIHDVKWFNAAGSKLDRALIKRSDRSVWIKEAEKLQQAIDSTVVERAFAALPSEVQDSTLIEIKTNLMQRKMNLVAIVERYYDEFIKFQMLTGTDKDDYFEIERFTDGSTRIKAFRIKDGEKGEVLFDRTFHREETNEIWLYGLDDDDVFSITGNAKKAILLRIIGGQNKDTYDVSEGNKVKIYDRRDRESEIKNKGGAQFRFTNFYEANSYNYKKTQTTNSNIHFNVGYNPDDGTTLSAGFSRAVNQFIENPYGRLTTFQVNYHFLTQGLDIRLMKGYAAFVRDYNFVIDSRYTSKNYTENFFGFGNETLNLDESLSLDYNRVNLSQYNGGIGLERESDYGSFFQFKYDIRTVEVVSNGSNFISEVLPATLGSRSYFGIPNATFRYKNYDNEEFPAKGMLFETKASAIDDLGSNTLTGVLDGTLTFHNALLSNKRLVLKTKASTKLLFGDDPKFYQFTQLGADTGLRAYRNQRFTGTQSLVGSVDLNYGFQPLKTFLFPLTISVYGGYDIGRVWIDSEDSQVWHDAYGGGFLVKWTNALSGNFSAFTGEEGTRVEFGFSFSY